MPWLRSLRPKKASALRTRQQAAPLQLVNLLPRSPNKPKPCKARRTRAPRLVQEHSKHDKQTTLRLDQGPEEHEADPFEFALSRASSGSLDLALPATLDEDMTHKASIEVATWPLGPAIESRMRPKQHGAEESKSQSLRPGKLKGASLQFPSRSFDLRESTFMDDGQELVPGFLQHLQLRQTTRKKRWVSQSAQPSSRDGFCHDENYDDNVPTLSLGRMRLCTS